MRDYSFNVDIAVEHGVDEAIFIHALEFWIRKNRSNERHYHDGRWWSYNSLSALGTLFPFWSRRQIERVIASCKEKGLVYVGDYNTNRRIRTCWYALDDRILAIYGDMDCISPNGEMHVTESGNAFHETVKSLNNEAVNNKQLPPIIPHVVMDTFAAVCPEGSRMYSSLAAFCEMRKRRRKPLDTERAAVLLYNKLQKISGGDPDIMAEALDESTLNGWTSVYAPKKGAAPSGKTEERSDIPEW